jgi:hypothetical protein
MFGLVLFDTLMRSPDNPKLKVAAVCAHEFGHILWHKWGLHDRLIGSDGRVAKLELHADYLAGTGVPTFDFGRTLTF